MYKSHCSCTGNEQVSVFVENEICDTNESVSCYDEITTSCCAMEKVEQCKSGTSDCDCNKPEITYFKLIDKVVNEEVKFTQVEPIEIQVLFAAFEFLLNQTEQILDVNTSYIDPPPTHNSSQEFLVKIQQLKIPHIA